MTKDRTTRAAASATLLWVLAACGTGTDGGDAGSNGDGGADRPYGSPSSSTTSEDASVTELRVPGGTGRCMAPNVRVLRAQEVAFEGTVTQVADGEATLEVSRWFVGEETDLAVVRTPAEGLVSLGYGTELVEGEDYLVSATDGDVTLCGFTGPVTPRLETLYLKAYGG